MSTHLVTIAIEIDDADPTRCHVDCCHLERVCWCSLFRANTIGGTDDRGPKQVRCAACVAAVPVEEVRRG
jgi:hypothetical protein